MDFGNALNALRAGHKVAREKWANIARVILSAEEDMLCLDRGSAMDLLEWTPSTADLLATDWEIVD